MIFVSAPDVINGVVGIKAHRARNGIGDNRRSVPLLLIEVSGAVRADEPTTSKARFFGEGRYRA